MLTPTIPGRPAFDFRRASRDSTAANPWLLKPKRLITASSAVRRNRRGRGLPGCGSGVTVPTSVKPKPSESAASTASPFLSKPAARPIGLGKSRPNAFTARRGSSDFGAPSGSRASAPIAIPCAVSGSRRSISGRAAASRPAIRPCRSIAMAKLLEACDSKHRNDASMHLFAHFRAKWISVRVKKMRQDKKMKRFSIP